MWVIIIIWAPRFIAVDGAAARRNPDDYVGVIGKKIEFFEVPI
jgi:hypothetical protein